MENLTNSQKSIWVTEQYYKGSSVNSICGTAIIEEKVDFKKLEKAIKIVCNKHDSFRLKIKVVDGKAMQELDKKEECNIENIEVENLEELENIRRKIVKIPFKIEESSLFQFYIFKLKNGTGAFMLNIHHIISDAWTLGFICNDIIKEYSKLMENEYSEEKAIYSYVDYINSEKEYLNSEKFQKDKKYWEEKFENISEIANIPGSKDAGIENIDAKGNRKQYEVNKNLVKMMKEYSKKNKISLYNFFMAIYAIYIGEITNLDEFVIGTPILNRTNYKEKNVAGMFINTVPFKITLTEEEDFQEFAKTIAKDSLQMLKHQKYSYQLLLENLREKDKNTPNLYNILLSYQITNAQMNEGNIKYKTDWTFNGCVANNLEIQVYDLNDTGSLNIAYDYKTSIYEEKDIDNVNKRIMNIIEQVLSQENIKISDIDIVVPEEKEKIVVEFNKTELEYDTNETVIQLFKKQAEKIPNKIAIVSNKEKFTYSKIDEKSNQLAQELLNQGIEANDIIGIMLNRTPEMVIGLLAILKIGATYLPIDPEYPSDRILYMLENSETKTVLVNKQTEKNIPKTYSKIDISLTNEKIYNKKSEQINQKLDSNSLAYLIYTSGSTGKPKGVMVTNRNLNNFVKGMKKIIDFSEDKVMVSVTTICFDIFGLEIWCALTSGQTLVLANEEEQNNPVLLNKLCLENKVNIIQTTPSRFSIIVEDKENLAFLKNITEILVGGESLNKKLLENMKKLTKAKIYNMYGPTETTIWSTVKDLSKENNITVGKPIANTKCYILNKNHKIMPVGIPGELYIGGDGVSNGYLKREELTNEKFIESPFEKNKKIYNTNDLAYFEETGEIVHLGRTDFQIKIRGYRVELGEIENVIEKQENIKQCVVVKRKMKSGHDALIAYFTVEGEIKENLKEILNTQLPQYMVPQYFVKIEKMPYTPNGKIDRKSLPEPEETEKERKIINARNEIDKELIKIIKKMLKVENVSLSDYLLELGGDSLTAITLSTKILSKFNVQINIKDILSNYSIKDISDYIAKNQSKESKKIKIEKAPKQEVYPLSSAQKRIYYNTKMIGEKNTVYNMPGGILVDEILEKEKVENAFSKIIQRHSILKTSFVIHEETVMQKIQENIDFEIPVYQDTEEKIQEIIKSFPKPFILEKAPLIRVELHYIDNKKTLLLLDTHHIIMDGTGLKNLIIEFSRLYNGEKLKTIPIQYKDYAVWENKYNESEEIKKQENYWVNKLKDSCNLQLDLPYDYKFKTERSYKGEKVSYLIEEEKFRKIEKYAKKIHVSPYMLFISTFFILLYKYTGQEEILLGSPVVNRNINETKRMIGMFVNNIVIKARINPEESFLEFLSEMKEQILEDLSNQNYPFDMLVKNLGIVGQNSRNPLFDCLFTYQNNEENTIKLDEHECKIVEIENNISKFNLSLEIKPKAHTINIEYCSDIFKKETIEKLYNHYINTLKVISKNKEIKIKEISVISEKEKNQILDEFNDIKLEYSKEKTISQLFEEQAKKTPDNIAIVFGDEKLTYRELNEKSNQLAYYLRKKGIKPNDIIGIMLPRSLELLCAIIGVLKSGACYIPIDPTYPEKRIKYMLENSEAKQLLTINELFEQIEFENKINVELENEEIYYGNVKNLKNVNNPEDTSYIIYTSGSTGLPKGVVLKHKSLSNLCADLNSRVEFLQDKCKYKNIISITTASFDIFIFETLVCLQKGLKIIMANEDEQRIPVLLDKLIKKNDAQIIQMTPSRMQIFLDNIEDMPNLSNLKYVTLAGEALPIGLRDALKKLGVKKIYNGYGPSETTVFSSFTDVTECKEITIGVPIANTQNYILDKNLKPVPIGVAGELYISGDGVGKGYLNRQDLTQERYIKNPFIESSIMYKTGDVCKYDNDGNIYYLGRADNQVKIRGLRIELEEIENKILEFPNIKKAKVIKQVIGNREIISAYYISSKRISLSKLRKHLQDNLPNYMIPSYFTALDEFPYTPNGKIDKNALPVPSGILENEKKQYIEPKTDLEKKLVSIFEEVLDIKPIGINDNFFELGGDSILAMNLNIKLLKITDKIKYSDIFKFPTIKELSKHIDISNVKQTVITKSDNREYYPASSAQKRMYLSSNDENDLSVYNITGGILLDYMINIDKIQNALDIIVDRHDILRTCFNMVDGNIVQKIEKNIKIKLNVEEAETNDVDELFYTHQSKFDLGKAPLFKVFLLKLPNGKILLMIDTHHIIFDGTSLNNLLQEIYMLYNEKGVPEITICYKDFAVWEEEQLLKNTFKESKEFWLKQFSDEIPILNMPTTYSRPVNKNYEGANLVRFLDRKSEINILANKYNVTPNMLMLSIYYILLYKYTGQEDIIVGVPVSGRMYEELKLLIGMFVNTMPLRNKILPKMKFEEFLLNVKKLCVDALEHQDYPFDELVNDLNIPRDISRNALFDTMFVYQSNKIPLVDLDGIKVKYCIPKSHTSKVDITLEIVATEENMKLSFEYCTKLFSEEFMNEFANHYINILETILNNPDIMIEKISIFDEKERNHILNDFNNTKMEYPKDKTIANLFEEQVEKTPNKIAIVFEDKKLTYKELNEKSNQLANYLKRQNIKEGKIVGIMLPRSLEVIISMLAVLKIGACYIPIDPTLPKNRINYMLSNSNVNILLSFNNMVTEIKVNTILNVELSNKNLYNGNCQNLAIKVNPEGPSYMIYTSGSTGIPKGVVLKNKALVNLTTYLNKTVEFLQDEYTNMAIASITTISFDIFIFETLICLQRGLKIVLANETQQNTPNLLNELILKNNVKAIQMTPSRMYIFLKNKELMPNLNTLKYIVLAGEALPKDLLNSILELGDIKVYNGYGPSETTVFSSFTDVTNYENITIGKPLANTRIYILDKDMNICPIGKEGEIYISGDGVAIGYSNNEEMTKERFLPDIFYQNEIMYKTGDIAKYLSNGEIHYIGRSDNQIKVRGLRIELDEIENCILKYPNIEKCVISANQDSNYRQYIIAYLKVTDRVKVNSLRMFLRTMLPKYMIPSYFIILDEIPYLNNGKINKKALPKPKADSYIFEKENYVAPTNNLELQIANIFQNLLAISPIGIDDNFFELGGDSLLAINLQVELLKLNLNITYSDVFMYPTIRELASKIMSNQKSIFNKVDASGFKKFDTILENTCKLPEKLERKNVGNIFITGTTGFLGAHVLDTFLKNETGIAYCLIRPEVGLKIEEKLIKKLNYYFDKKYDKYIGNRIKIINADITKDNLDLSNEEMEKIANNVSVVINCAAKVSHYGNYNDYKKVNVDGTENLIKFCMKFNKTFYQISTLSVSGNSLVDSSYIAQTFEHDVIFRENNLYINQSLDNVYVRSKFEAEELVLQYIMQGLDGYICRVGNLMNRNSDGKFQPNVDENAYISRLISLAKVGCIPDYMLNSYMEFTPVDSCANAILKIIQYSNKNNRIFHLFNHYHVDISEFINIIRNYINFDIVSNNEFIEKINDILKKENSNEILSGILRDFDSEQKLVYESKIKLKSDFTIEYLSKIDFTWPKIDEEYLQKFLNYFWRLGYITKEEKK